MAVLPINSVSVNTNNYAFTGKSKNGDSHNKKANPLASVPVIVMLAMAPTMADGRQPAQLMPVNSEQLTEVVAQINAAAPDAYEYAQVPQSTKKDAPLGVKNLKNYTINLIHKGTGNGTSANFVFASYGSETRIDRVMYVDTNFIKKTPEAYAPEIIGLVYHDLGKDKEFCSVKVMSFHKDNNGNRYRMVTDKKIDDKSAQLLIDLLAGDSKWDNNTDIKFYETKNPKVAPPKVLD